MGKVIKILIISFVLLGLLGCKDGSSNNERVTVFVELSEGIASDGLDTGKQYKSFQSDVNSVLLQVFQANPEEKLSTSAMIQNANGAWSIDLVLDASSAPFVFKALAYEGSVTPETENANTPIFTGVSENINGGGEAVILLAETEESRNESLRTLPSLGSVDKTINADASIDLIFNLSNQDGGVLAYELNSVSNDGTGVECVSPIFTPSSGSVNTSSATLFESELVLNEVACTSPKHFLIMTTSNNDTVKISFNLNLTGRAASIALPPVIEKINVIDNETSFTLDVVVTDSDSLDLLYVWSVTEGSATFDTKTTETINLSELDRENTLSIVIEVTNNTTGAASSIGYKLIQ